MSPFFPSKQPQATPNLRGPHSLSHPPQPPTHIPGSDGCSPRSPGHRAQEEPSSEGMGRQALQVGMGDPSSCTSGLGSPIGRGGGVFCPAPSLSPTTIPPSRALAEGLLCGKAFQFWYPLLCLPKATGIWYLMRGREGLFVWPDGVQLPYSRDGGHGERGE